MQGELQEARQSLIDQLGKSAELDRLVYKLTFVQCLYLRSIYQQESLRCGFSLSCSIHHIYVPAPNVIGWRAVVECFHSSSSTWRTGACRESCGVSVS